MGALHNEPLRLTNAQLVLPHEVVCGTVYCADGIISDISHGRTAVAGAVDCGGDFLMPGLVELHTDNLEKHAVPRPQVRWPVLAAFLAHDAELTAAGITTVLNGITVGTVLEDSVRHHMVNDSVAVIVQARADGITKADHYLHLRCEISTPNVVELLYKHGGADNLRLVSLMDHTPGQRQWVHVEKYRARVRKLEGLSEAQIDTLISERLAYQQHYALPNEQAILAWTRQRGLPLASHDDATHEHAIDAARKGIHIAEFPTTKEAAKAARHHGLSIVLGAPNMILGGSHSGNVAAAELAAHGLLDILSSDYVPASLLAAAVQLHIAYGWALPEALATVTATPARAVHFTDRGTLAIGKRADILRVALFGNTPLIRSVWRTGKRIA
jgi:alpha-D-ribose 1-methylphosphonate 5-triphosphate diphosphatase